MKHLRNHYVGFENGKAERAVALLNTTQSSKVHRPVDIILTPRLQMTERKYSYDYTITI